jgi:exonuclease III
MLTRTEILAKLTDLQTLALTAWAEARGDSREGNSSVEERIAVLSVIRNRLRRPRRFGDTYKAVCLAKWQFSCWNPGTDANHQNVMRLAYLLVTDQPTLDPLLDETLFLADGVMRGIILDRVMGADHYYAPKGMVPRDRVPDWAKDAQGRARTPLVIVGDQRFYTAA